MEISKFYTSVLKFTCSMVFAVIFSSSGNVYAGDDPAPGCPGPNCVSTTGTRTTGQSDWEKQMILEQMRRQLDDDMRNPVGGGGGPQRETPKETKEECLADAAITEEWCLAGADMDHVKRLQTGCAWVAGFPVGDSYQACYDVSIGLLNANNHSCAAIKAESDKECNKL